MPKTVSSIKITVHYFGFLTRVTVMDEVGGHSATEEIMGHCVDENQITEIKARLTTEVKEARKNDRRHSNGRSKTVPQLATSPTN